MKVKDLFEFKTGSLPSLELTEAGDIPLVYGTTKNNGIVKFVKIYDNNDIFQPPLITVSYLGTAFVQLIPFTTSVVDKSNIIILKPKEKMTVEELYYYAAQINYHSKFTVHYGRRMNMRRLSKLELKDYSNVEFKANIKSYLPENRLKKEIVHNTNYKTFNLSGMGEFKRGNYHSQSELETGKIPFISCTTENNGIVGFYKTDKTNTNCITIASDGTPLTSYYHSYEFSAQDNVIILKPKKYKLSTIFYIILQLRLMRWRFSYGRKCYLNKIDKIKISLPVKNNNIDEEYIEKLVNNCYGWGQVKIYFSS